jgi:hypothetical protein
VIIGWFYSGQKLVTSDKKRGTDPTGINDMAQFVVSGCRSKEKAINIDDMNSTVFKTTIKLVTEPLAAELMAKLVCPRTKLLGKIQNIKILKFCNEVLTILLYLVLCYYCCRKLLCYLWAKNGPPARLFVSLRITTQNSAN